MSDANKLRAQVIEAHGGLSRWNKLEKVEADIDTGGGFFRFKGVPLAGPRRMTAWLHEQRVKIAPIDGNGPVVVYTPERVAAEQADGTVLAERANPRDAFAGHQMQTGWDPLHLAYFSGEALSTYFRMPFLLGAGGVEVEEVEPWLEGSEKWRVLRTTFPETVDTHSREQHFYFDDEFMLRRHDYQVDVAGGFRAAQLVSHPIKADGIWVPSKRRAYTRTAEGEPVLDMLMVSIDVNNVHFS